MKKFLNLYVGFFKNYFPSPFTIALGLTAFIFIIAFIFTKPSEVSTLAYIPTLGDFWFTKMFDNGLLSFTLKMMLILVFGHVMALSKPVQWAISKALALINNTSSAAFWVTLLTILVAYFNWGLGLIFGAIFARKVAEHATRNQFKLNYALIGACAYAGLMVWHGGLSGSAPLTVNKGDHSLFETIGVVQTGETLFSSMNILVFVLCITVIPIVMYFIGKYSNGQLLNIYSGDKNSKETIVETPAEKFETSIIPGLIVGALMLLYFLFDAFKNGLTINFLTLNNTCLMLFGMALLFHGSITGFLRAISEAIKGASGILVQFPLYFGIMGIMEYSGLALNLSNWFVSNSSQDTLPIYTFISAGIVNIFVPSGGGQWQVQGPIIMEAANQLGVAKGKMIMALAYGDQLTNMLQPFWALPLLGITGLKAKDILPYTLLLFLLGGLIFLLGLHLF